MNRRRPTRSRLLPAVIASFYAGGVAGWLLHAAFAPDPSISATSAADSAGRAVATAGERAADATQRLANEVGGKASTLIAEGRLKVDASSPGVRVAERPSTLSAIDELRDRDLTLPIDDADVEKWKGHFEQRRGGGTRGHEAVDILAPRHTAVRAVEGGTIAKLFTSRAGGITLYQFDPTNRYTYYYAHLQRYAPGLREGQRVEAGDTIGYVGTTGNAPPDTPHLHFAIFEMTPQRRWWEGTPIDPYLIFRE
jgi:murein DD-endopeptidase MepM/ murein hydrolase activator NlpD